MSIFDMIVDGKYEHKIPYSKENCVAYNQESSDILAQFKHDLEHEYGVADHPKRHKLFQKAYEYGHASGYHEVANHYSELVDLVYP